MMVYIEGGSAPVPARTHRKDRPMADKVLIFGKDT